MSPTTFQDLVDSRKAWIDQFLQPWCRQAGRADLIRAEHEWLDIAGRASADATLWTWAWSRFPDLVCEGLAGVNEAALVQVTLADGRTFTGYPDNRRSRQGVLVLLGRGPDGRASEFGPFSIDEIAVVRRA